MIALIMIFLLFLLVLFLLVPGMLIFVKCMRDYSHQQHVHTTYHKDHVERLAG